MRCQQMICRVAHAVADEGLVVGLRESCDFEKTGNAASSINVWLNYIHTAFSDEPLETLESEFVFPARNHQSRSFAQVSIVCVIVWRNWFLKPRDAVGLKTPRHLQRVSQVPRHVDVQGKPPVRPHCFARLGNHRLIFFHARLAVRRAVGNSNFHTVQAELSESGWIIPRIINIHFLMPLSAN